MDQNIKLKDYEEIIKDSYMTFLILDIVKNEILYVLPIEADDKEITLYLVPSVLDSYTHKMAGKTLFEKAHRMTLTTSYGSIEIPLV